MGSLPLRITLGLHGSSLSGVKLARQSCHAGHRCCVLLRKEGLSVMERCAQLCHLGLGLRLHSACIRQDNIRSEGHVVSLGENVSAVSISPAWDFSLSEW